MENVNKVSEIGSEFDYRNEYLSDKYNGFFENGLLTYSGRTAIGVAVCDILKYRTINKAWLPSYCCDSMAQPFRDLGICVDFYSVEYDFQNGRIVRGDFDAGKNDVVLSMDYFGFCDEGNTGLVKKCRDNGVKVIEDCTHSLLSGGEFLADYRVSSLRKWFPIACGGFVEKRDEKIDAELKNCDSAMIDTRILAMKEKTAYLADEKDEELKRAFLDKYKTVNKSFSENYINLSIDPWSAEIVKHTDLEALIAKRRENAKALLGALRQKNEVRALFTELAENACPLFLPILADNRSQLQKKLAENKIYCPAHWPKHSEKAVSKLYDLELSLICDQRYGYDEMKRISSVLS